MSSSAVRKSTDFEAGGPAGTLSEKDFQHVARRIYDLAGIVLEPQKKQMIHARLSRRLRATGISDFPAYLEFLESGKDKSEQQEFINAITTNLTSFFRENHHFDHFRQHVLPASLQSPDRRLRVWSAGCSSGEEPYSIALTILAACPEPPSDFRILATDLDTRVLDKAATGLYSADKAGDALSAYQRYARKQDDGQTILIQPQARNLISFLQLNLMQPWPMKGSFDAIFCRNVLIYFDPETKSRLVNRFAKIIRPEGFLYLGHSESILGDHPAFENLGQTTYRRRAT
ncbi:CheR family methyltransferase [Algicella marina]|uniref:Chemotaxis protein methyltransferase n=1 Tax=Algicella marina TaxID=2683284 RepID=A0A6P1T5Z4_9RHOB|nr:protein-glutamate O-methyltransferase CheR [Algicella marina]QHQ36886.1 chemotaxis protein CheR [Algicella marina]